MLNIKTNNQEQNPVNRKGTTNREEKINELLSRIRGIEFEIVDKEINIVLDLKVANTGFSKRGELEELCERPNIDGDIDDGIKKCGYFVHQLLFLSGINKDYHFNLSMKSGAVNVQQPVQGFDKSKHTPVPQNVLNPVQSVECDKDQTGTYNNKYERMVFNPEKVCTIPLANRKSQYIEEKYEERKECELVFDIDCVYSMDMNKNEYVAKEFCNYVDEHMIILGESSVELDTDTILNVLTTDSLNRIIKEVKQGYTVVLTFPE